MSVIVQSTYSLYRDNRFDFSFIEQIDGISNASGSSSANSSSWLSFMRWLLGSTAILGEVLSLFTIQTIFFFTYTLLFGSPLEIFFFPFFGDVLEASPKVWWCRRACKI